MRFFLRHRAFFMAAAGLAAGSPLAHGSDETLRTFDTCWRYVRSLPRAKAREDLAWDELRREYRPRVDAAQSDEEVRELLNEMLGEVGVSHTAVLDRDTYRVMMREIAGKPSPTFGVLLEEMEPGRLFVRARHERGPVERAGLLLGDEIVAVGGRRPLESERVVDAGYDPRPGAARLFTLRAEEAGEEVEVAARSEAGGRARRLTLAAESTSSLEVGRRSARVVRRDGARIGVLHLWMVARGSARMVWDALRGPLSECDALVLDLRGRGGLADEIGPILAPFRTARRKGAGRGADGAGDAPAWTRPVVFLIDDRTRSAKEITAWNARDEGLGPLVGERTEGAVLGASFVPLPGGHWLELGAMEVPVRGGLSLEGLGVEPTHPVARLGPYARGVDPILEEGLRLAASAAARRSKVRGPY